jgi:hypothetical protein
MRILDKPLLEQLSSELALLCSDMLELEASILKRPLALHEAHRRSARNLAHYLALRRHDVRQLQSRATSQSCNGMRSTLGQLHKETPAWRQNPSSRCPQRAAYPPYLSGSGQKLLG